MRSKSSRTSRTVMAIAAAMLVAPVSQGDETDPVPPELAEESDGARQSEQTGNRPEGGTKTRQTRDVEVNKRREAGQTITEYSRNGEVFLMTVKPRGGPTQYWNDPDGDGQFQRRTSDDIDENVNLPKWRLGTW